VFELASTPEETLIATFPSDKQIENGPDDLFGSIENGELVPEGEELDALEILRSFARDIEKQHFKQMDKSKRSRALLAFRRASKAVVSRANFIISTNNNVGDTLITTSFGQNANSIWVIRDKDPEETQYTGPFKL
jgi:hypothetical protein